MAGAAMHLLISKTLKIMNLANRGDASFCAVLLLYKNPLTAGVNGGAVRDATP